MIRYSGLCPACKANDGHYADCEIATALTVLESAQKVLVKVYAKYSVVPEGWCPGCRMPAGQHTWSCPIPPCPLCGDRDCGNDHPDTRCPGCGAWDEFHSDGSCVLR